MRIELVFTDQKLREAKARVAELEGALAKIANNPFQDAATCRTIARSALTPVEGTEA